MRMSAMLIISYVIHASWPMLTLTTEGKAQADKLHVGGCVHMYYNVTADCSLALPIAHLECQTKQYNSLPGSA